MDALAQHIPVILVDLVDDYTLLREDGLRGPALSDALLGIIMERENLAYPEAVQALNDTRKKFNFSLDR